ncbi:MAG TPA: hypothetical protein VFD97_08300 [Acidimicrobiia bacterium]|nr:hypothetical protein [Acidimicrobiia bacterium]
MIIETLAATAIVFLLIVVITQVAFVVVAHDTARTAVAAAARRAGRPGSDAAVEQQRLAEELTRVVPGASAVNAVIEFDEDGVSARAAIRWTPPGPDLIPITLRVEATAPLVVPP